MRPSSETSCKLISALAVLASVATSLAHAQTAAPTAGNASDTSTGDTLQEVVVTAERRTQDIQKTAVSVTALSGDELEQQGRYTVQQVLQDVPGVTSYAAIGGGSNQVQSVVPSDNPALNVVIRGVPSDPQPVVGSAPVSTAYYADGIYNGVGGDFDINRVEVLRGPQGTLYGRSATSGVLAIYTRDPTLGKFGADALGEFGSYQLHHVQAAVNLPLGDTLAVRIAANQFDEQGQVTPKGTEQKEQEVRIKLLYKPNSDFSVLLGYVDRADYDNSGGSTEQTVPNEPYNFFVTTGPTQPIYPNITDQHQLWAKIDWNLGIGTLTYIPAYHTYDTRGSVSVFEGFIQQQQNIDRDLFITHELRLTSNEDSPIKWVVGATYYSNNTQIDFNPVWTVSRATVFLELQNFYVRDIGEFAEVTIPIAPTWRFTAGLRYDNTKVQVSEVDSQNNSNGDTAPNFNSPLDGFPLQLITGTLSGPAGNLKFDNITYKARIEKDLTAQNLLYGMVSTGFLPGFVSLQAFGTQIEVDTLSQEKLTSYEIGSKNRFFDDHLQLNGDVFFYQYQGYQTGAQINPVIPNTFVTLSSPARMTGVELEAAYLATKNDRFNFTFGHTNAYFVNQPNTATNPFTQFVAQTTIPGVVPTSAALSYDHTFHISGGSTIDFYDQVRFMAGYDESSLTATELADGAEPYIHVGNQVFDDINLSWTSPSSMFHGTFYVHNVGNEEYKQNAAIISLGFTPPYQSGLTTNFGRFYGVVLRVTF